MSVASLVLSIIGFLISVTWFKDLAIILCVLSVALGIIGVAKKKNRIIGIIAVVLAVLGLVMAFKDDTDEKATEVKAKTTVSDGEKRIDSSDKKEQNGKAEYEVLEGKVTVWKDSIQTKYYTAYVPIKNTGKTNLYLGSASIDIENSSGKLEDTAEYVSAYPQVIKPGEVAYYCESTFYEGNGTSGLKAILHPDVKKSNASATRYTVSEVQIKNEEYLGTKIIGRVENNTSTDETSVYVSVNLFDSAHNLLAQEYTILSDGLSAGQKKGFEITSFSFNYDTSDVASYDVYAFPYQYQW